MTYSVYIFEEPYTSKSVGRLQIHDCLGDKEAAEYCAKLVSRPGVREVNAFTNSGRLICNLYKSDKIKLSEKI